ncbi:uridine diphosphate-N-acetylglucosamine-binding protein YvcK [Thermosipho sp. 1074]|uniref:gluconeogenesis factor YvcK family protein n=1 Tax=Thermosipho sp. 1074 TaxID=1643331 RepID=UPI00098782B4|nr:uridine diphosphate-N-acetylglucosamine-binding protein YvcK [Thermosipho sp. 1074]OOC42116.1 hypothetical protein XO08_07450 [Thermosipho sp. 1074]
MNFVVVGGGTGVSTLLRGLKYFKGIDLKAIITVTDEGGSSGVLRREYNIIPPGDIRNNLVALAKDEEILGKLFSYRFSNGFLSGHTVGNIILTALTKMLGSFTKAVEYISEVLAINGKVIPVSEDLVRLVAFYEDGTVAHGESEIMKVVKKKIIKISLDKETYISKEADCAIKNADVIILGPGSIYTSIIPNLLVNGFYESLNKSKAKVVYVSNLMTQPSESYNFTLSDHVTTIERYLKRKVDYIIVSYSNICESVLRRYLENGSVPVEVDMNDERIIIDDLIEMKDNDGRIRHNPLKLASLIIDLIR